MRRPRFKRAHPLPQPRHLERQYEREIGQVAILTYRLATPMVLAALPSFGVFGPKQIQDMGMGDPFSGRVTKTLFETFPNDLLQKMLRRQGEQISVFQRQALTRQLTQALGVGFWAGRRFSEKETDELVAIWIKTNIDLIKTIPPTYLDRLGEMIQKSVSQGLRVEEIAERVKGYGHMAQAHANLIARDQTLKLYGRLNKARQKSVGIERYRWRGMLDEAEREMHRDLEGQVFTWDDPPVTNEQGDRNEPGGDYQCRCSAEPILE